MSFIMNKFIAPFLIKPLVKLRSRKCHHNIFGISDLVHQEKVMTESYIYRYLLGGLRTSLRQDLLREDLEERGRRRVSTLNDKHRLIRDVKSNNFKIKKVTNNDHQMALDILKQYYFPEHVLVKAREMDLSQDHAVDEYLINVFRQGNSMYALTEEDDVAAVCVNYAYSQADCKNLVKYASYRQDPNTKEFLNFIAKLQETPNLWDVFKQQTIFEIKMLAVVPEFRRQGLGVKLADLSRGQALEQGHKVVRMNCINPYDFKIAERCFLQCIARFPLHKLGGPTPFVNRCSDHNICIRVYVDYRPEPDKDLDTNIIRQKKNELECLFE